MIDLRNKRLPEALKVGEDVYPILTDFRLWIAWGEDVKDSEILPPYVFPKNEIPPKEGIAEACMRFYAPKEPTPHGTHGDKQVIDYILDGSHIVASFQQAYGIDLTSCDMHWWRFLALLNGLPDNTSMSQIESYRAYKTPSKSDDDDKRYKRLRQYYSLPQDSREYVPERNTEEEQMYDNWIEENL